MAIFDISQKSAKKIYTFEEIVGGKPNSNYMNSKYLDLLISHTHRLLF